MFLVDAISMLATLWEKFTSRLFFLQPFYYNNLNSTDKTVEEINNIALEKGYVEKDDFVINLTAMPIKSKGMVNTLRVSTI